MRPPPKRPEGRNPTRPAGPPAPRGRTPRPDHSAEDARKPARARPERDAEEPRRPPRGRAERIGEASAKPARARPDGFAKPARGRAERFGEEAGKPVRQRLDRNADAPPRSRGGRVDRRGEQPRGADRGEQPRGADRGEQPRGAVRGEQQRGTDRGEQQRGTDRGEQPRGAGRGERGTIRAEHPRGAGRAAPARIAGPGDKPRGTFRGEDPRRAGRARAEPIAAPPPEPIAEPPRPGAGAGSGAYWIYGHHAVLAALSNPRRKPRRLLTTTDAELALRDAFDGPWRVTPERADRARFHTFLTEDAVHQGIALLAEPLEPVALEDAIEASDGPVLLLDQVTDPRNVGAALRAAAAFGAAAVVMQDRHSPHETGTLARAASGTLDIVPVVREVNLSRAIATLQKAGFWVLGLAADGGRTLAEAAPRDRRVALVMGAEDSGLRRLQRETCDELVRLPMVEGVESLNVAAAAAVALYEIVRR